MELGKLGRNIEDVREKPEELDEWLI